MYESAMWRYQGKHPVRGLIPTIAANFALLDLTTHLPLNLHTSELDRILTRTTFLSLQLASYDHALQKFQNTGLLVAINRGIHGEILQSVFFMLVWQHVRSRIAL